MDNSGSTLPSSIARRPDPPRQRRHRPRGRRRRRVRRRSPGDHRAGRGAGSCSQRCIRHDRGQRKFRGPTPQVQADDGTIAVPQAEWPAPTSSLGYVHPAPTEAISHSGPDDRAGSDYGTVDDQEHSRADGGNIPSHPGVGSDTAIHSGIEPDPPHPPTRGRWAGRLRRYCPAVETAEPGSSRSRPAVDR